MGGLFIMTSVLAHSRHRAAAAKAVPLTAPPPLATRETARCAGSSSTPTCCASASRHFFVLHMVRDGHVRRVPHALVDRRRCRGCRRALERSICCGGAGFPSPSAGAGRHRRAEAQRTRCSRTSSPHGRPARRRSGRLVPAPHEKPVIAGPVAAAVLHVAVPPKQHCPPSSCTASLKNSARHYLLTQAINLFIERLRADIANISAINTVLPPCAATA